MNTPFLKFLSSMNFFLPDAAEKAFARACRFLEPAHVLAHGSILYLLICLVLFTLPHAPLLFCMSRNLIWDPVKTSSPVREPGLVFSLQSSSLEACFSASFTFRWDVTSPVHLFTGCMSLPHLYLPELHSLSFDLRGGWILHSANLLPTLSFTKHLKKNEYHI